MKNLKIPRKLKKEIVKVESIVKQPYWVNPQSFGVRLKSGVKVNKWTVKLINKIIAEQKRIVRKAYNMGFDPAYGKDYSVEAGYVIKDGEIDK